MECVHKFRIADFNAEVIFKESPFNNIRLLPSFVPFQVDEFPDDSELLFRVTIDDDLPAIKKGNRERIGTFDPGNGDIVVDLLPDGGYQYIFKDVKSADCCLLQTSKDFKDCHIALNGNYYMRSYGLSNALMLIFSFAGSLRQTLLIHASLVRQNGYGYAFTAKSGTGKSTQVSMWLRHIPGCDLMNDDNPIVRVIGDECFIYGSPWSGKTPCYRNVKARLGAITRIDRAPENSVDKMPPIEAFASFLPSCSSMRWDKDIFDAVCNNVTRVVERVGIYTLHCRPDREAAEVCHAAIAIKE